MKFRQILVAVLLFAFTVIAWVSAQDDRVGFPKDYQKTFKLYHSLNNEERKSLREILINSTGAKAERGKEFPYGTVIVMLGYRVKMKDGQPVKDDKGLYVKEELTRVDVMRKEKGFGKIYGDQQSGEWEYGAYRPNGDIIAGDNSRCAGCHMDASASDYVFSAEQLFKK